MTSKAALLLVTVSAAAAGAQAPLEPAPAPADFGQWETLAPGGPRGGLSPDGAWLAWAINRSNRENELHVTNIADGTTKVAAFATRPAFSADSRWIAYAVGYSESQEEKLRRDKKPIHRKLGLIDLAAGNTTTIDGIESFASGAPLAMRRYPLEKPNGDPADDEEAPGATLIVRTLATGRNASFGNVSEYAWQDRGGLLALVINAEARTVSNTSIARRS